MNNADPFAAVRLKPNRQQQQMPAPQEIQQMEQNPQDPFSAVRLKKSEDMPFLYETGRHAARIGSRVAETIGGIPGDVGSLIQSGVLAGLKKFTGHELSEEGREEVKKYRLPLPTSKELKDFSEEQTGGFTKAQNKIEESVDQFAETAASLLGPMKFRKALGVAAGASLAKEGIKIGGFGEGAQEAGKLGTMLMLTAINPKGAMKYASLQFDKANQLSKGASILARDLESGLTSMAKDLQLGVTTNSKNAVAKPIQDILGKIKNGKIAVHDLTAAKRDLSSLMGDPQLLKREKKLLKGVAKQIDNAIKPYEKINPAFSKAYRPANEIYGAVTEGNKAYNFMSKSLGTKSVLGTIAGEVVLGHPEYIVPTLAAAGGAMATAKITDFFIRLGKSRELQKYYTKALAAAAAEDLPSLRIYSDKIEKEMSSTR